MKVVEENKELGYVRLALNQEKGRIKILKGMLLRDGYTEDEIEKILKHNNKRSKEITERALCRLFTYGEGVQGNSKLYLLPWCIDKWRKFVKERKAFKYWISYLENRSRPAIHDKRVAFEKWAVVV